MDRRLKSKILIDTVFTRGKTFFIYPVKMFLLQSEAKHNDHVPYRCGVSVSKRNIKLAVNRNLVKRRMREAFRLQVENTGLISTDFTSNIMLVYVGKEVIPYNVIHQAIKRILKKVIIK